MREDIDTQPHQFKSVLTGEKLRKTFFPAVKNDEAKVVAAFCNMSKMNALKKKPKVCFLLRSNIVLLVNAKLIEIGLRCGS